MKVKEQPLITSILTNVIKITILNLREFRRYSDTLSNVNAGDTVIFKFYNSKNTILNKKLYY